jgi:hypothetical protein
MNSQKLPVQNIKKALAAWKYEPLAPFVYISFIYLLRYYIRCMFELLDNEFFGAGLTLTRKQGLRRTRHNNRTTNHFQQYQYRNI